MPRGSMVRKSMAALLMELGTHETLKKVIQEAREILSQGKAYAKNLIRAWIERKAVKWREFTFQPGKFGVAVYIDDEYERSWTNRAIEAVFYKVALEDDDIIEEAAKAKAEKKAGDEDQISADVNVELPNRRRKRRR
jgi:hypothetical protein